MKVWTGLGKSEATRDSAAGVGTMIMGKTQDNGFKVGNVRAREGTPGSTESQVEQMVARG